MPDTPTKRRRIAFYAPLKAPDHPVPSGDRLMARLLMQALDSAGYEVALASRLRSYARQPDAAALERLELEARATAQRLLETFRQEPPDLWLTYHPYYKSPDLLGPTIAEALRIPYATAEASHAAKRNRDAWQPWQAHAERALQAGAVHFCMTRRDHAGLAAFLGGESRLVFLPPFLDTAPFEALAEKPPREDHAALITVAMMRPDGKLPSYRFLAAALGLLRSDAWHLTIIGDGSARAEVEGAFAAIDPARLTWRGLLSRQDLLPLLSRADLFVWPGLNEAYGMSYLEAEAAGLPVLALDSGGIGDVVAAGRTGVLVPPASPEAFAAALDRLIAARGTLGAMGQAARAFVLGERNLASAAAILHARLDAVLP